MNINKISNSINIPKKINIELPKIEKEKVANVGKKALTGLSCLAAVGYYLVANQLKSKEMEQIKPEKQDDDEPKTDTPDGGDIDGPDGGYGGYPQGNEINPGYDGKTKVLLALTTDGRCVEIYQLSDGRLISPADYHFPGGRSLSELTFSFDDDSYFGGGGLLGVGSSSSRSVDSEFGTGDVSSIEENDALIYQNQIMGSLRGMNEYESIIEELCKPENEELYNIIFNYDETDPISYGIMAGYCTFETTRRLIFEKLNPEGFNKDEADNSLKSRISVNLWECLHPTTEEQLQDSLIKPARMSEREYYYQQQRQQQKQYVFA